MISRAFTVSADVTRIARLTDVTRRAFQAWGKACDVLAERRSAIRPSQFCIAEAGRKACHLRSRFEALQNALAQETGSSAVAIYNRIAAQTVKLKLVTVSDEERMIEEAYRAWGGDDRAYELDLI